MLDESQLSARGYQVVVKLRAGSEEGKSCRKDLAMAGLKPRPHRHGQSVKTKADVIIPTSSSLNNGH